MPHLGNIKYIKKGEKKKEKKQPGKVKSPEANTSSSWEFNRDQYSVKRRKNKGYWFWQIWKFLRAEGRDMEIVIN